MTSMIACKVCNGKGWYGPVHLNKGDQPHEWVERMGCAECDGTGKWTRDRYEAWLDGRERQRARIERRESLGEMAARTGVSVAELSGIERGRAPTSDAGRRFLMGGET